MRNEASSLNMEKAPSINIGGDDPEDDDFGELGMVRQQSGISPTEPPANKLEST